MDYGFVDVSNFSKYELIQKLQGIWEYSPSFQLRINDDNVGINDENLKKF